MEATSTWSDSFQYLVSTGCDIENAPSDIIFNVL